MEKEEIKSICTNCGAFYSLKSIPEECYICGADVEKIKNAV
jgi:rubrerythrin